MCYIHTREFTMAISIERWRSHKHLRKEYQEQLKQGHLGDAFAAHIDFGTGGLRGIMGVGTNRINDITIMQATLGFADYLLEQTNNPTVVIAYDTRNDSKRFAIIAAKTLAIKNISTRVFQGPRPTPQLSFAVRKYKATGGIVITASHNPPAYNGYKIYDEEGCQLVPDKAKRVSDMIEKYRDTLDVGLASLTSLIKSKTIKLIPASFDDRYVSFVKKISPKRKNRDLTIVYTPLHGTGAAFGARILKELGFRVHTVQEQLKPDGNFTTVGYPNPEDTSVFKMAKALGNEKKATLLLATDPDADRLGVAAFENGTYVHFSGSEIGILLLDYLLANRRVKNHDVFISTIVTPKLGEAIALDHGLRTIMTLTGFKFIGEQIAKLSNQERFFFGYEESCGYLASPEVRDKDAFQAMALVASMMADYQKKNQSLSERLDALYRKYGYYGYELATIDLTKNERIRNTDIVMEQLRKTAWISFKKLDVLACEDYSSGTKTYVDGRSDKIKLPTSDVIKLVFADGGSLTVRPSGTEPKLKIYMVAIAKTDVESKEKLSLIKTSLKEFIDHL